MKAWINGEFVGWDEANVSLLSHSFGRGSAIFEVFDIVSAKNGPAFFGINEHIDRLIKSAELIYMNLPLSKEEIIEACKNTARENDIRNGATKMFAYYPGLEFYAYPKNTEVNIAIFCADFAVLDINPEKLSTPVDVGITSYRKYHPDTVPIHAKVTGNYVNPYLSLMEMKEKGYEDIINIDVFGHVAEGATSSVFTVKDGKIRTAKLENVLNGITRMAVIETAKDIAIPIEETDIKQKELFDIDEAFYAVSLLRVQPIKSIDGQLLGSACPGPVTEKIIEAMNELYSGKSKRSEKWVTYI